METQTHYYILPNGQRVNNRKEACLLMGISSRSFNVLVKKGTIQKFLIHESKLQRDENLQKTNN